MRPGGKQPPKTLPLMHTVKEDPDMPDSDIIVSTYIYSKIIYNEERNLMYFDICPTGNLGIEVGLSFFCCEVKSSKRGVPEN